MPWGLDLEFIDMADPSQVETAMRPNTRLLWFETPSNPMMEIVDIRRIAEIAQASGAISVIDGTLTTPVLQRPLDLGVDLVVHSTTKFLGGHGDVVGGTIISKVKDEIFDRIRLIQQTGGAVPSPFDCWLILRGICSIPYRVRAQTEHAGQIAAFLHEHPLVETVHYPGHAVAAGQMVGFGAMLSFQVRSGERAAVSVAAWTRLITRATSLGGAESLIEHRASIEGRESQTPVNLLRLSVGLENPADLIEDFRQAFERLENTPRVC